MEAKSRVIEDHAFCIWFEKEKFYLENLFLKQQIVISQSLSNWLILKFEKLLSSPVQAFFQEKIRYRTGTICLAKFCSLSGWFMVIIFWALLGGKEDIHVPAAIGKEGWSSFLKMCRDSNVFYDAFKRKVMVEEDVSPILENKLAGNSILTASFAKVVGRQSRIKEAQDYFV